MNVTAARIKTHVSPGAVMDVRVGQSLMIGNIRVTVERKAGQIARLRVVADEGIVIQRSPNPV